MCYPGRDEPLGKRGGPVARGPALPRAVPSTVLLPQMMEHQPYPKTVPGTGNSTGRVTPGQDRRMGSDDPGKVNTLKGAKLVCAAGEMKRAGLKCWEETRLERTAD